MKTPSLIKVTSSTVFALFLGALATSFAGPGPQYWTKSNPPAKPAAKAAVCAACKDTPVLAASDRAPAGKGVSAWKVIGTKHDCTLCDAARAHVANASTPGGALVHAAQCGAMGCCSVASR
jgi:hypothetical protein